MKITKKIVRYIIITAGAIILTLIAIAAVYKDRVAAIVIDEINSQSQFRISISRSGLSLLKKFPRATFWIQDVVVRGTQPVSGNDTIGTAALLSLDFRLTNLLRKNYTVEWISWMMARLTFSPILQAAAIFPLLKNPDKISQTPTSISISGISASVT
ncbi:MAG: hypothetical protein IH591_20095 [Bacteroidales bacterium]|nr:hypothetical protein [Bacteroidales bacterium]